MKHKIFIDALGIDKVGGGRTSILTLLEHMFYQSSYKDFVVILSAYEPSLSSFHHVEQRIITGDRFAVRLKLQARLPYWVRKEKGNLVHFTKNLGIFGLPCPYVVTIHDLTALILKQHHHPIDVLYWRWIEPLTARYASRVIAVSQDAAHDVHRYYGVPKNDIEVIYWASPQRFRKPVSEEDVSYVRERYDLPDSYLLFLGSLARKKNLVTLLKSLEIINSVRKTDLHLVVVGRVYPQSAMQDPDSLIRSMGIQDWVHLVGCIPDEELPIFYAASLLYVLPSLHEGFGIPCLEAMSVGVPVIVTRGGALPEIVGDAGLVVDDPLDAEMLAEAIIDLIDTPEFREELIERGRERARDFSWAEAARATLAVYNEVLDY